MISIPQRSRSDVWPAATALVVLAAGLVWTPDGLPDVRVCLMHRLTGLPCPACGLTRSFCAISHGRWGLAWAFNPFGFPLYAVTLWLACRPVARRLAPGIVSRVSDWRPAVVVPVFAGAMGIFGVLRLCGGV